MESSKPSKDKVSPDTTPPKRLRIGKVVGCHGLKGELKIRPASEDPDWVETLEQLDLVHPALGKKTFEIVDLRFRDRLVYAQLETLPDRTAAEVWVGAEVQSWEADMPDAEEGAYRVHELVGLRVVHLQTGELQGTVHDVLSASGSDFLEICLPESQRSVVVPFLNVFFPTVHLEKGEIYLDKVDSLADLAPSDPTP